MLYTFFQKKIDLFFIKNENYLSMALKFKSLKKNNLGMILMPKIGEVIDGKVINQERNSFYIDLGSKGIGIIYGIEFQKAHNILKNLKPDETVSVKILDLENENGYRDLSVIAASRETIWDELKKIKEKNEIVEAKILKPKKGGLLVEIKGSLAFLPFSLLSPSHYSSVEKNDFAKLTEVLQGLAGQVLKTRIIELDTKNKRIIVSEKATLLEEKTKERDKEKEREFFQKHKVGDFIEGEINNLTGFGATVELENGLIGFLYSLEIPNGEQKRPDELLSLGQKIKAKIIKINENNQIYLSLKEVN